MPTDRTPYTRSEVGPLLDPGVRDYVVKLRAGGVETFESCQGGPGHAYLEPTVRFAGNSGAGFHALSVAIDNGMPVAELRRTYPIEAGWPTGPYWELTFSRPSETADV